MPDTPRPARPVAFAVFLVIAGALGLLAAFELSVEKILTLSDPSYVPGCNVGVLVGCSTNLASQQGSLFGFPNPFIGLMAWPVVITIGMAMLAHASFSRWFWIGLNAGMTGALALVIWLIAQSIYVLDVLCPWCMLTWAVTIPTFWAVTFRNLREGVYGGNDAVRRVGSVGMNWIVVITIACYVLVVLLAQLQMNAIPRVISDLQTLF
ncbi:vitamin K epoxide reductase family protein [Agromyces aurantiacus]|uniref:Vitamin K epoxide reductase family protein n=1 Tax=Agromyces aurantiacus TaxID=165814 RepID=A0ABV9R7Z2_9MICO|nr:vitamin K epoxide reductase family protein [Agromyces aurantiacus]MBM7504830.1 putative membrane protein [Agromyces aurantiacus]